MFRNHDLATQRPLLRSEIAHVWYFESLQQGRGGWLMSGSYAGRSGLEWSEVEERMKESRTSTSSSLVADWSSMGTVHSSVLPTKVTLSQVRFETFSTSPFFTAS